MIAHSTSNLCTLALILLTWQCYCEPLIPIIQSDYNTTNISNQPLDIAPIEGYDFLECQQVYGEAIPVPKCEKAFELMRSGDQYITFTTTREPSHIKTVFEVPVTYSDDKDNPSCLITVDLAGKSETNNHVAIRKNHLRDLFRHVNNTCLTDNHGRAGWVTYKIKDTIRGMAKAKPTPDGFVDIPLFLTVLVSQKIPPSRSDRPGNTDPKVNQVIQTGLNHMIKDKQIGRGKRDEISNLISSLQETYRDMHAGYTQPFWDPGHITSMVPDNVRYVCYDHATNLPKKRNCEDLSYTFLGQESIEIFGHSSIKRQKGDCLIQVDSTEKHMIKRDVIRAAIGVLLNRCVNGETARGYGGRANAMVTSNFGDESSPLTRSTNLSLPSPTLGLNASPSPSRPPTPHSWKLPSTVVIWVEYAKPNPLCDSIITASNGAQACELGHHPVLSGPLMPGSEASGAAVNGSVGTSAPQLLPSADGSFLPPESNAPSPTTGLLSSFSAGPGGGFPSIGPAVLAPPNVETS